ncbi:carbohydrate porin [Lichenicoccus sp.]|uniref:carbohydrate porin n=1 Tax=Lichenicoccus sp. TaxID=2781899 RepID=UPI003D10A3D5
MRRSKLLALTVLSGTGGVCGLGLGLSCLDASPARAQSAAPPAAASPTTVAPQLTPELSLQPQPALPAAVADNSPARFDDELGVRGWNLNFPSFGDTLTGDVGGYRTALADYGLGFESVNIDFLADNLLNVPKTTNGELSYEGQSLTAFAQFTPVMTIDLSRYGIPDGQILLAATIAASDAPVFISRGAQLYDLNYYQSLFNNHIQVRIGYISNEQEYVGIYTAGRIAGSIFGPAAFIPFELGLSGSTPTAPGANVTFNFTGNAKRFNDDHPRIYDKIGLQRSLTPAANDVIGDNIINPTGFRFTEPGSGVLFIDEVGYRTVVSGVPQTWFRAGGIYNTTEYQNYRTGGKSTNSGFYVLGDQQIWQPIKSGPARALGLYAGFSVNYAAPDTNVFTQYYEGRIYAVGLVPGRPRDLGGVTVSYNKFSPAFQNLVNSVAPFTRTFAKSDSTSVTASYAARLLKGAYLTTALTYTDNPTPIYTYQTGHALVGQIALTTVF